MTRHLRVLRSDLRASPAGAAVLVLCASLMLLATACGGGGQGMRAVAPGALGIGTALPQLQSGDAVDFEIPISGGCDGPYVIEVIGGRLPNGVGIDTGNARHNLVGTLLEDGSFTFTLKVTDTKCIPFMTNTASFSWVVGRGPVRIVMASPPIIPNAAFNDPNKYENSWGPDGQQGTADDDTPGFTIDALETVVYGSPTVINLVAAGGRPPYSCAVVDDPNDPFDDVGLPTPTAFAVHSCSIIGTPIQVLAGGLPFRITVRVTDGAGTFSDRKFQWKIDTPPIIQANESLVDGTAGSLYSDVLTVVDGVPPILHEFVDELPKDTGSTSPLYLDGIQYVPGDVPIVPQTRGGKTIEFLPTGSTAVGVVADSARLEPVNGRTKYPLPTDQFAQYSPYPPEGIYIVDETQDGGALLGIPRRFGNFEVIVHSYSTLVPNERGQHAIRALEFTIAQADPAVSIDPGWTVEQAWIPAPVYSTLPEFEIGQSYDPEDDGESGLRLLAAGGVPADRLTDNPHFSELQIDTTETEGGYAWRSDWLPDNPTPWDPPPAGLFADAGGLVGVSNPSLLVRTGRSPVEFEVRDYQLPEQYRNTDLVRVMYSVGPDVAIITYSTTSESGTDFYYASSNRFGMNDVAMTIQKFEFFAEDAPARGPLTDLDIAKTHGVPAIAGVSGSNTLGALISGVTVIGGTPTGGGPNLDLLRCVVNATGWWDDQFSMNPKGAQPFTHCDASTTDRPYGEFGYYGYYSGNWQPPCSAVDLPNAEGVSHDPANGIYANGGQCYHFESDKQYGMFIVRTDAKVYVPFAESKPSANSRGFGDGLLFDRASNQHSALRTVQMTVSPDGRFAAMKLKSDQNDLYEHADNCRILFVSLTGEKVFGESSPGANDGATYRIVPVSATGLTGTGNRILYASSMALTNGNLYCLIGTQSPSSNTDTSSARLYYQSWHGHFLMRCGILSGALHKIPSADAAWTQGSGLSTTMQTVFHHHGPNGSSSSTYWGLIETSTSYGRWPYHRYWQEDGMNFHEHNVAPAPFRVSANGKAVAFFAAADTTSTASTDTYSTYAWVDYDGAGATRITGSRRHHSHGSGRSYRLSQGPAEYANWGRYHGPTPGVEISDDGLAVAFVYNTASTMYCSASYSSSSNQWMQNRENVLLTRSTSGAWSGFSESQVTASTFAGSHRWRFGSLAFTAPEPGTGESTRLVFWGGAPMYQSTTTSYTYNQVQHFHGAYYVHTLGTTNSVTSMLATADGGNPNGAGQTYTTGASAFAPTTTSGINNRFGAIHPYGGFMSKNRKFLYIFTPGPINSSDYTTGRLIGLNVGSDADGAINGHPANRGFVPAGWPSRRGFVPTYYYYYGNYAQHYYGYSPFNLQGISQNVMARDTGWVFWMSNYQYYTTTSSGYTTYGPYVYPAAYNYGYAYGGLGVYGFNADLGGAVGALHKSNWVHTTTSPYMFPSMLEVSRDGKQLAQVYCSSSSSYPLRNTELVRGVRNIDFGTPNGSLSSDFDANVDAVDFETSNGRAGAAMACVSQGADIYYAFKAGSTNENNMNMIRQRWNAGSSSWTKETATGTTGTGRINVLWAGR